MPRRERRVQGRALVAAAKNYSFNKPKDKASKSKLRQVEDWQFAAWDFFDVVPEYSQGCNITGALLSRAKLVVVERMVDERTGKLIWKPTENEAALEAGERLFGGEEGQSEMLRNLGVHFSVAGGAHLIGPVNDEDMLDPDKWLVAASTELSKTGDKWRLNGKELEDVFVIELWKRHPRDPRKYMSPTRAILPVLNLLVQLMKRSGAQIDSRLTGNGLFLLPSEIEFPALPTKRNPGDPEAVNGYAPGDLDGLIDTLVQVGSEAMFDQSSPASTLPVFGTVPGEYLDKGQHYKFWSELDAAMPALELALIRRIALGMDMPPEVLLGNAGSNHWNAWLSDENSVKIHGEPLLRVITSSITSGWLRPALDGFVDNVFDFAIGADTSQMRMRPNRSKESIELFKHGALSEIAMRRENGFDEADAPTDEERQRMLVFRVAGGSTTPELVDAALKEIGVDLGVPITDLRAPAQARPFPSGAEHPVRELPERSTEQQAAASTALVYAAEQMVDRALQRAGNRMKTKYGMRGVSTPSNRMHMFTMVRAEDCDDLLEDAWSSVDTVSDLCDPLALRRALDIYTRSVIIGRREPSRRTLASALKLLLPQGA